MDTNTDPKGSNSQDEPSPLDIARSVTNRAEARTQPPRRGELFGSYRIGRLLGEGGYGQVWEAENLDTGRRVALKVLIHLEVGSSKDLRRFEREGRLAASLNHPSCVYIFGAEEINGYPAISMELMVGGTLQDKLKEGLLAPREAVDYALDIINGLEAAQEAGIIHRDVKPSNCFIDETGSAKIGDFGISRSLEIESSLSTTGSFLGTPFYASPEQALGEKLDFRSDLYSLGATLYELLTGRPPFEGDQPLQVLARILTNDPPPISQHNVTVAKDLENVVKRLLSKEKEKRYQSYASVRAALLPFSSVNLSAGSLARRFGAIAADLALLYPLPILAYMLLEGIDTRSVMVASAFSMALMLPYFALSERYWGRSVGKHLFRLRVASSEGMPITLGQAFLRSFVFVSVSSLPDIFHGSISYTMELVLNLATMALIVSTMRRGNGFAGLHELVSGTRVVTAHSAERLAVPERHPESPGLAAPEPRRFGPYREANCIWETESEALLIARDDALDREIWIHRFEKHSQAPSMELLRVARPGRLRWLQGARIDGRMWDAYGAPTGSSFQRWVEQKGRLNWEEFREILLGISVELQVRLEEQASAGSLSLRHIWVDGSGQPILLDFPITTRRLAADFTRPITRENWRHFLHQLTVFGLEGQLLACSGSGMTTSPGVEQLDCEVPGVPLPEYTRPLMNRICGRGPAFESIDDLVTELRRLAARPARIRREQQLGPLLLAATPSILLLIGFLVAFTAMDSGPGPRWRADLLNVNRYATVLQLLEGVNAPSEAQRKQIEAIRIVVANSYSRAKDSEFMADSDLLEHRLSHEETRELLESALSAYPSPNDREVEEAGKLVDALMAKDFSPVAKYFSPERSHPVFDFWYFALLFSCWIAGHLVAIPAVILAPLVHGGVLLRLFGLSVQLKDGRRANWARCLLRSFVAWSPLLLLVVYADYLVFAGLKGSEAGSNGISLAKLAIRSFIESPNAVFVSLIVFTVWGMIHSILKRERGVPDLIARTWLVPT